MLDQADTGDSSGWAGRIEAPFRPLPFSPPPPTVIVNAYGKPAVISATPPSVATDHDRPTLRFPVVPPPVTPPQLNVPEPLIDINEPTLEEKPVRAGQPMTHGSDDETAEIQSPLAQGTYPGGDAEGDAEARVEAHEARGPKPRIANLRPRKKGQVPRKPAARPAQQDTSDGIPQHPHIEPIDPAAWLADEAHARTSDRLDSADGVDNSDMIVPTPRTRPNVV